MGMNLQALVKQYHKDLMGDDPGDQLIRVAYLDTDEICLFRFIRTLNMHAGRERLRKIRAWYILQAEEDACIVAGTTIKEKEKIKKL